MLNTKPKDNPAGTCGQTCEAVAFLIVIRNLRAELAGRKVDESVIKAKAAGLENASSDTRWGFEQGAHWMAQVIKGQA